MAGYNSLPQADVGSNSSSSGDPNSPTSKNTIGFAPLALDFDNLGGGSFMQDAQISPTETRTTNDGATWKKPGSVLSFRSGGIIGRSRGTSAVSYEVVEDDDYNVVVPGARPRTRGSDRRPASQAERVQQLDPTSSHPQTPVHSVHSVPLAHPTPDLQSIQGAYVSNVEHLERTAESFDLSSHERTKALDNAYQCPTSSAHDSVVRPMSSRSRASRSSSNYRGLTTLNDGVRSPDSQVRARTRSGSVASKLARVIEPENEGDHDTYGQPPIVHTTIPQGAQATQFYPPLAPAPEQFPTLPEEEHVERPTSAASGNTYREGAHIFFENFNGIHCMPGRKNSIPTRRVSITRPPLASQSQRHDQPAPGMVYYPAPVPMVLNLPQRTVHHPQEDEGEKRQSEFVHSLPADVRKSAAWLPDSEPFDDSKTKRASAAPPQARASAFFAQQPQKLEPMPKGQSAVNFLDNVLEAAAEAPVGKFVNHFMAGEAGAEEVYGKSKRKKNKDKGDKEKHRSVALSAGPRDSIPSLNRMPSEGQLGQHETDAADQVDEETPFRRSYERDQQFRDAHRRSYESDSRGRYEEYYDEDEEDRVKEAVAESSDCEDEEEDERNEGFVGRPATLIAELQIRKREQKQRKRHIPQSQGPLRSTLLELDAVAQRQRQERIKKNVTLAWQDPGPEERCNPDDEDVPLGILLQKTRQQAEEDRPTGLMEQLDTDAHETLAQRRARLKNMSAVFQPADMVQEENDSDDEPLAARRERLKAQAASNTEPLRSDFASEVLSKFQPEPEAGESDSDPGETLAERRRRLKAEAAASGRQAPSRLSTANYPVPHDPNLEDPFTAQPTPRFSGELPMGRDLEQKEYAQNLRASGIPAGYPQQYQSVEQPMAYPQQQHTYEQAMAYGQRHMSMMEQHRASMAITQPGFHPAQVSDIPYNLPYRNSRATPYGNGLNAVDQSYLPPNGHRASFAQIKQYAGQPQSFAGQIERRHALINNWRQNVHP